MKHYFLTMLATSGALLSAVAGVNYQLDPLQHFPGTRWLNEVHLTFNERKLKVNLARFGGVPQPAIVFGSSRCALINGADMAERPMFNFALNKLWPHELEGYLAFAEQVHGAPFQQVLLGLDFPNSRLPGPTDLEAIEGSPAAAQAIVRESGEPLYRWKSLLSADLALSSGKTLYFMHQLARGRSPFDQYLLRESHRLLITPDATQVAKARASSALSYRKLYAEDYQVNPDYPAILKRLRAAHPRSEFRAFIPPESAALFDELVRTNQLETRLRWLAQCVEVFDRVLDFGGLHAVSTDPLAFIDGPHPTIRTTTLMTRRVLDVPTPGMPAGFGVWVTRANLAERMAALRQQAAQRLPHLRGVATDPASGRAIDAPEP